MLISLRVTGMYLHAQLVFKLTEFRKKPQTCLIHREGRSQVIIFLNIKIIKNSKAELHYAWDIAVWRTNTMTLLKAITATTITGRNEGSRYQRGKLS
jgi:hypothetical protein